MNNGNKLKFTRVTMIIAYLIYFVGPNFVVCALSVYNYAFPKEYTSFCKVFTLYYTRTQCNILIIIILLQPKLENDHFGSVQAKTATALAGLWPSGAQPYCQLCDNLVTAVLYQKC